MKPVLIADCYLDERGSAHLFQPIPGVPDDVAVESVRASRETAPSSAADFGAVILTGSAASVLDPLPWVEPLYELVRDAAARDVPVLGVCFGHQVVAKALFGDDAVRRSPTPEIGWHAIEVVAPDPLFEGIEPTFRTFLSHFDDVRPGLDGIDVLARSARCPVQAFRVRRAPVWCVQFHAEMDDEETERLVRLRSAENPHLGVDAEHELANRVDSTELRNKLLHNFALLALGARPRPH